MTLYALQMRFYLLHSGSCRGKIIKNRLVVSPPPTPPTAGSPGTVTPLFRFGVPLKIRILQGIFSESQLSSVVGEVTNHPLIYFGF